MLTSRSLRLSKTRCLIPQRHRRIGFATRNENAIHSPYLARLHDMQLQPHIARLPGAFRMRTHRRRRQPLRASPNARPSRRFRRQPVCPDGNRHRATTRRVRVARGCGAGWLRGRRAPRCSRNALAESHRLTCILGRHQCIRKQVVGAIHDANVWGSGADAARVQNACAKTRGTERN